MSCHHLIASISKSSFILSGSALNLHLCFASMSSTNFLLHSSCAGVLPYVVVDGASLCDVISIDLDILVHEQLDVFIDRQVHRHLVDCIPNCALNGVFDSILLEAIVPMLLRGR